MKELEREIADIDVEISGSDDEQYKYELEGLKEPLIDEYNELNNRVIDINNDIKEYGIGDNISDGHHTFSELYDFRLAYNVALFNTWGAFGLNDVHKSKLHDDGSIPFGDPDMFIVVANTPSGQISNHYNVKHWDLFEIEERDIASVFDGHTPSDVVRILKEYV